MLSYFVVDRFPFIALLTHHFFPHPHKTRDVVRSRRLTGLGDFIETALGLFETASILRTFLLSRASNEWPCDHRPHRRKETRRLIPDPKFRGRNDTTLVAECLKRRRWLVDNPSCLGSVTRRWPAKRLYSG